MLSQYPTDVILRSSEKESFYSWKILLSMSSPLFSDMFTLPQPDGNVCEDGLPVIDVEEDSRTLGHILSLCHPPSCVGKRFKLTSLPELRDVLEAADKYDMGNALRTVLEELSNPSLLRQDPLGIYALACQYGCHEAARLAAKHTLTLPCLVSQYVPALEKIHAGHLYRLLLYRQACTTAVCALTTDHTWIDREQHGALFACACDWYEWYDRTGTDDSDEQERTTTIRSRPSRKYPNGELERVSMHKWWIEYMRKSKSALQRRLHGDAVTDNRFVDDALEVISSSECKQCRASRISKRFQSFVHDFAEKIDRRVEEVEIVLGF